MRTAMVGGIFVGGDSRRMGYRAKGLLVTSSGETIVERWCRLFRALGVTPVLVGQRADYARFSELPSLADDAPACGPLGGLVALLRYAGDTPSIAVACDMPYVSERLLNALATHPSTARVVAPRTPRGWEPLFARYGGLAALAVAQTRLDARALSLQGLLDDLGAEPWLLSAAESAELRDWDEPSDMS